MDERLETCGICGNVDTANPCAICADPRRDQRSLCVVEEVADLWALERSRLFPGRFHVLGGRLSALEGVRPEDLAIDALVARIEAGGIDEVVLAMNATLEGQTTAHYLADRIERFPVRVTQLAHGLPVGGDSTISTKARWPRPCAQDGRSPDREVTPILTANAPGPSSARWQFFPSSKFPIRACA